VAPATTPPDASFTTPSIEPELPDCALAGAAAKKQHQSKHHADTQTLEHFFSIPFEGYLCFVWIEAAGKNGGGASLQMAQRTEIQFESEERLNRRRSATCTMQRKGIAWRHMPRQRRKTR